MKERYFRVLRCTVTSFHPDHPNLSLLLRTEEWKNRIVTVSNQERNQKKNMVQVQHQGHNNKRRENISEGEMLIHKMLEVVSLPKCGAFYCSCLRYIVYIESL